MLDFIRNLLRPEVFISSLGPYALAGITLIIFAESGLFFGFFLPGDSLLFTAGLLSAQGFLPLIWLVFLSWLGAVLGDNVGYWFGHTVGPKIFAKEESWLFKKHHLEEARRFYDKHGAKTIVLARFVPFVRTFAPIVAGAAQMHYSTFMLYNLLGGALWTFGLSLLGYFLGNVPVVKTNYEVVIVLIVVASLLPVVSHIIHDRRVNSQTTSV